jgi:hypothetical protein
MDFLMESKRMADPLAGINTNWKYDLAISNIL